jgi:HSP20 family protein
MADIMIRNNGGRQPVRHEVDPAGIARELLRWDPFREIVPSFALPELTFAPAFEIKETKEGYLFKADLPGVVDKDLEITRTGNRLTVSGRREAEREDKGDTYYACERSYGSFVRSFTLPEGVDGEHIHAALADGVLTMMVPKLPEAQPQKIAVKGPAIRKS